MPAGFSVTLVESPNTPIIGVGEGTWPTLALHPEEDRRLRNRFLPRMRRSVQARCQVRPLDDRRRRRCLLPSAGAAAELRAAQSRAALADQGRGESFCDAVCPQGKICDDGLAPKSITTPKYRGDRQLRLPPRCRKVRAVPATALHARSSASTMCWPTSSSVDDVPRRRHCRHRHRAGGRDRRRPVRRLHGFSALLIGEALGVPFSAATTCFFATRRSPCRSPTKPRPHRLRPIPFPPHSRRAGSGMSACPAAAESAMSTRASHISDDEAERSCAAISVRSARSASPQDPDPRRPSRNLSGNAIASPSGSPRVFSSRSKLPPSC